MNGAGGVTANGQALAARRLNLGIQSGAIKAGKGATVNVTYGDGGEAVSDLTNQFLSTLGQITDGQADQTKTLTDKLSELLQNATAANSSDKSAVATDGLSTIQKTLFGLGALALAGVVFWPRKHK